MFGPHLILEGYKCRNIDALGSESGLINLLNSMPGQLEMNIIMPPRILDYDGGDIPEDKGISGFVIIAESHIAIHTFPNKGFFTLDIFSCKEFDIERAIEYVNNIYQPSHYEHKVLDRGREFPRCNVRAGNIMHSEREILI